MLHYSGALLEWLAAQRPDFLARVRRLAADGRIEVLGGAMYEPVLAAIPRVDRLGQIRLQAATCETLLGARPRGMWLAERVWEPELPAVLAEAGVGYTLLDDHQFVAAGLAPEATEGYVLTEDGGKAVGVYPISGTLRRLVPARPVEEVVTHLRGLAAESNPLAVFADDGEKFVEPGWLERFFAALERESAWLATTTLVAHKDAHPPLGTAYFPSGSYPEMEGWSLAPDAALERGAAEAGLSEAERERLAPWLRGGFWRGFLARYPEAGYLHKRAAYVSDKVHRTPRAGEAALRHLWRAQTNAPYWHGASGGAYSNFLRSAAYRNLVEAENLIEPRKYSWLEVEYKDLDLDGFEEVVAESHTMNLCFHTLGGTLKELDYRPRAFNLLDTFARRPEPYHPPGLVYDAYERRALVDHFVGAESSLTDFAAGQLLELGDFTTGRFEASKYRDRVTMTRRGFVRGPVGEPVPVELKKAVRLVPKEGRLEVEYRITNRGEVDIITRFGSEWNFSMLAGDAPDRYYVVDGRRAGNLLTQAENRRVARAGIVDEWLGLEVELEFEGREALLWRHPISTLTRTETGLRELYQSSLLLPLWDLDLPAGRSRRVAYGVRLRER